jgi:hypothetical protein
VSLFDRIMAITEPLLTEKLKENGDSEPVIVLVGKDANGQLCVLDTNNIQNTERQYFTTEEAIELGQAAQARWGAWDGKNLFELAAQKRSATMAQPRRHIEVWETDSNWNWKDSRWKGWKTGYLDSFNSVQEAKAYLSRFGILGWWDETHPVREGQQGELGPGFRAMVHKHGNWTSGMPVTIIHVRGFTCASV